MNRKINMIPLSIIVAVDKDGGFGKKGKIPWFFPEDLKHFQKTTKNSVCIMGRRTYVDMLEMVNKRRDEPLKGKETPILKGRDSYVVTSNPDLDAPGATVVSSIRAAIQSLTEADKREVFVIGGERMYIEALAYTNVIYMSIVKNKTYDCDRFFPIEVVNKKFKLVNGTETDELQFLKYTRTTP